MANKLDSVSRYKQTRPTARHRTALITLASSPHADRRAAAQCTAYRKHLNPAKLARSHTLSHCAPVLRISSSQGQQRHKTTKPCTDSFFDKAKGAPRLLVVMSSRKKNKKKLVAVAATPSMPRAPFTKTKRNSFEAEFDPLSVSSQDVVLAELLKQKSHTDLFLDRETQWIEFNKRVLDEARACDGRCCLRLTPAKKG
jgi:hypothetical protein